MAMVSLYSSELLTKTDVGTRALGYCNDKHEPASCWWNLDFGLEKQVKAVSGA